MKNLLAIVFSLVMATAVAGCENNDGAAENVGEKIDNGMSDMKDKLDDAGNEIEDACEDATGNNC